MWIWDERTNAAELAGLAEVAPEVLVDIVAILPPEERKRVISESLFVRSSSDRVPHF
jgi:hypothetical protein